MQYRGFAMWATLTWTLLSGNAQAGFVGYPFEANDASAYVLQEDLDMVFQVWTAVVERCEAFGVATPEIIETWTCSTGTEKVDQTGLVLYGYGSSMAEGFYTNGPYDGQWLSENGGEIWLRDDEGVPSYCVYGYVDGWRYYYIIPTNGPFGAGRLIGGTPPLGGAYWTTIENTIALTTEVTLTNAFGPFDYDMADGSTGKGYPYVTQYFMAAVDSAIESLAGHTVAMSIEDGGTFNSWFDHRLYEFDEEGECTSTNLLLVLPMNTMAGIADRVGVGYVTNRTGYSFDPAEETVDFVTGGDFAWTRQPEITQSVVLAEAVMINPAIGWSFRDVGAFDTRFYSDELPVLHFLSWTNKALSGSVTIAGTILIISNQTTKSASEVVTVFGSMTTNDLGLYEVQVDLTLPWYDVTAITGPSHTTTGDVLTVKWDGPIGLYGDQPFRLYSADVDERIKALKAMLWTSATLGVVAPDPEGSLTNVGYGEQDSFGDWEFFLEGNNYEAGHALAGAVIDSTVDPVNEFVSGTAWTFELGGIIYPASAFAYIRASDSPKVVFRETYVSATETHRMGYTGKAVATFTYTAGSESPTQAIFVSMSPPGPTYPARIDNIGDSLTLTSGVITVDAPGDLRVAVAANCNVYARATVDIQWVAFIELEPDVVAHRESRVIGVDNLMTNVSKTLDLYMIGAYPGTSGTWESEVRAWSDERWDWDTNDVLFSWGDPAHVALEGLTDLHPEYLATNTPGFTWDTSDVTGLDDLNLTKMVFIDDFAATEGDIFRWTGAVTTNIPYGSAPAYGTSKGWRIRQGVGVVKWDLEYD